MATLKNKTKLRKSGAKKKYQKKNFFKIYQVWKSKKIFFNSDYESISGRIFLNIHYLYSMKRKCKL